MADEPVGDSLCGAPEPAQAVAYLTNLERLANGGLAPLKVAPELEDAAYLHSVNMAERNFFAHCDLDTGDLPWDRMRDAGYNWSWAAENISAGESAPEDVVDGWMNSSGHRRNILDSDLWEIGVGYYYYPADRTGTRFDWDSDCVADGTGSRYYRYWTQKFGRRNGVYPLVIDLEAHMTTTQAVDLYVYGAGAAVEMRLRNGDGAWTEWVPHSSLVAWSLSPGNGTKSVYVELKDWRGNTVSASDEICLESIATDVIFEDGFDGP